MAALAASPTVFGAVRVPYLSADEAYSLLHTELERFTALLDTLAPDDWGKSTACTAWNVREMLAHQAGGYASGTGYREMIRQYTARPKQGQLPEDAINELQLRERADKSPTELIAELRRVGPVAIQNWAYGFRLIKPVAAPHPVGGRLSLRHLMWVIHSRDTWMHRLDICRATNRQFYQTREHDGRIVALVVRDVGALLRKKLTGRAIVLDLSGVAGGVYQVGAGEPGATIQIDALDFNIFASGRFTQAQARARASFSGDTALAEEALSKILVLY
ncbi:MAG: maleylpyruvate isomerase family mycothiol-dependent enzyme [Anaerolineae bacterium]|nr:maleylpyruvate isomerase family mycothiol-dependent enzyme [Anaerolineae bacterium]